jgi:hypothetical protein
MFCVDKEKIFVTQENALMRNFSSSTPQMLVLTALVAVLAGCRSPKVTKQAETASVRSFVPLTAEIPAPKEEPRIVNPGPHPSDAIVLFDGKDLSQWKSDKPNQPARWKIAEDYAEVNGTGSISTKQAFGDCQLHLEWATPAEVKGEGQGRGNSGILFQGRYEVQVLDSFNNKTYFHGQAGSVYKEYAPLVNACRKPGEWQTYDIVFHAPRFDAAGRVEKAATVTVLQNSILVQDNVEIKGHTAHAGVHKYQPHPLKQSLTLQDHRNPVRYRNIWIREL